MRVKFVLKLQYLQRPSGIDIQDGHVNLFLTVNLTFLVRKE